MTGTRYEIRVKGRLTASVQSVFHGMSTQIEPVETILSGDLEDQAALYEVLQQVHALGLELVEVRRAACADPSDEGGPAPKRSKHSERG
jgi:hypothetical protein